jgi:CubicO group peptidase (beta-lactamase class C family)
MMRELRAKKLRDFAMASPIELGFSPVALQAAISNFAVLAGHDGADSLAILCDGQLIHAGCAAHVPQGVWSITKTITSATMGLLWDDGLFDLDQPMCEVLPELRPVFSNATFRHFASMTSGYLAAGDEWPINGYRHGPSRTPFRPATQAQSFPGTTYSYWDSAANMLALALSRLAGRSLLDLFRERIAVPLRMDLEWNLWLVGEERVTGGSGNHFGMVQTSALDLLLLGELFRHGGSFNGQRLLSEAWCKEATSNQVPENLNLIGDLFDGRGCYGLVWWVNGSELVRAQKWPGLKTTIWSASGYNNNDLFVLKDEGIVLVRLGMDQDNSGAITDRIYSELMRDVIRSRCNRAVVSLE